MRVYAVPAKRKIARAPASPRAEYAGSHRADPGRADAVRARERGGLNCSKETTLNTGIERVHRHVERRVECSSRERFSILPPLLLLLFSLFPFHRTVEPGATAFTMTPVSEIAP